MYRKLEEVVVSDARDKALLFGLLTSSNKDIEFAVKENDNLKISVKKRVTPDKYSRLDVIYINNVPAGSIVSMVIVDGLYHMVGMYVSKEYRTKHIKSFHPELQVEMNKLNIYSAASFLLEVYLYDMLVILGNQITLEVTNNNERAWKLYEKPLLEGSKGEPMHGFRLLNKNEIELYAACREKKIKKWYDVYGLDGNKGVGVQWSHVPDYGGRPERWSTNRIYWIAISNQDFLLIANKCSTLKNKLKTAKTIMLYGSLFSYMLHKMKHKLRNKFSS